MLNGIILMKKISGAFDFNDIYVQRECTMDDEQVDFQEIIMCPQTMVRCLSAPRTEKM